jgi:serine/threonine protein kinase
VASSDPGVGLTGRAASNADLRRQITLTDTAELELGVVAPTSTARAAERYELGHPLASGGMATVYLGRMVTPAGFARTVAIKRLHPHVASDPDFVAMFFDEARLAMRIQHPNVVGTFDVAQVRDELLLVMDYVHGDSLVALMRRAQQRREAIPPAILSSIIGGVLNGLHAAHEARSEDGEPLGIVHRDVSPQNVIVGVDGTPRVLDFGVAKAVGRMQTTETGQVKGKLAYMAPEQMTASNVDRRADLFAAAVLLWEGLANERLFDGDGPAQIVGNVLSRVIPPPSGNAALDAVVLKGLSRNAEERFSTAREMAIALEEACPPATARAVEAWLWAVSGETLRARTALLSSVESRASQPRVLRGHPSSDMGVVLGEDPGTTDGQLLPTESWRQGTSAQGGRPLAMGAASALVAAILLIFGWNHRPSARVAPVTGAGEPVAASAPATAPALAENGVPIADAASDPAAFVGTAGAQSKAAGNAAGVASVTPTASAAHPRAVPGAPRGPGHPRALKKPDCTSPFTVTAEGIRLPRAECF